VNPTGIARRAALGLALLAGLTAAGAWLMHAGIDPTEELDVVHLPPVRHELAADVNSWRRVASPSHVQFVQPTDDLIVVDRVTLASRQNRDHADPGSLQRMVAALKARGGQGQRLVIAAVEFDPTLTSVHDGWDKAAIEHVLKIGFDGVLLTGIDSDSPRTPEDVTAMVERIGSVAAHVKIRNPDALVGLRGGIELIGSRRLRAAVDFVAAEHVLYEPAGRQRLPQDVTATVRALRKAQLDGIPVLVAEHLQTTGAKASARRTLESYGFVAEGTLRDGTDHARRPTQSN
jgi:hypothetical protein